MPSPSLIPAPPARRRPAAFRALWASPTARRVAFLVAFTTAAFALAFYLDGREAGPGTAASSARPTAEARS